MLAFDVHERNRIWLECWVSIDVWDDTDLCVGASLEHAAEAHGAVRTPVDGESADIEALQLRHVVVGANEAFDGSGMGISERMAVIGGEEVVRDAPVAEAMSGKPVPHPLAVARLEVVRPPISPHVNAVEVIVKLLVVEEEEPHVKDEMIVILVALSAVAEEVEILPHALSVADILQHHNAVLHHGAVSLVSDFRSEEGGSEVHQHQQLTRLEAGPHLLVVLALKFFVC